MNKMNRKVVAAVAVCLCAGVCMARPHGGPGFGRGFRRAPVYRVHHGYRHHHGGWGLAAGIVGGVVAGSIIRDVITPAPVVVAPAPVVVQPPVVVQQPVVVQPQPVTQVQNVWVEGRYVDQVQADGMVVRVWQPGHYEQRTVVVQ